MGVDTADGIVPAQEATDDHGGSADDRHAGTVDAKAGQSAEAEADVRRDEDRQRQAIPQCVRAHPSRIPRRRWVAPVLLQAG